MLSYQQDESENERDGVDGEEEDLGDTENKNNKNCLGSFQVLWNKNCTTKNEKKMKILIKNLYKKKQSKKG